jgi:hypothetical protein
MAVTRRIFQSSMARWRAHWIIIEKPAMSESQLLPSYQYTIPSSSAAFECQEIVCKEWGRMMITSDAMPMWYVKFSSLLTRNPVPFLGWLHTKLSVISLMRSCVSVSPQVLTQCIGSAKRWFRCSAKNTWDNQMFLTILGYCRLLSQGGFVTSQVSTILNKKEKFPKPKICN